MIVKNCSKENYTVNFQVELDPGEFEKHVNAAYLKNRSRIQVPGFRKGKASRMVIEGFYGKEVFYEDALEDAADQAFAFGAAEEKLRTVGRPSLTGMEVTEEKGALLSFSTDVWPDVTLGQYKGLEAEKDPCDVSDEEIDREIQRLRKQNGRMISLDRPAENGDTVVIDYRGEKDGVAFDGGTAEGYSLVLGSNSFIPGFEEKLIGISAGEERDLDLTFPQEYHAAELAGQDVIFHVKCSEVKMEELPEVDDDFAQDNDFDTVDDLKKNIVERLSKSKETDAQNAFTDRAVNAAAANMTVDVPPSMIEEQMDSIMEDYSRYITGQGIPFEQYVKMMGGDVATFRESTRPAAEAQVRTELLLDAVAAAESLDADEDEMRSEMDKIAESYKMKIEDVEQYVNKDALKEQIIRRKATALISESAVPVAPGAKEPAEKEEAAPEE